MKTMSHLIPIISAMAATLLCGLPASHAQTWVSVSVSATVPTAANIFDQARRVDNSYIERLRYNSQNGAFQIQAPCDFINIRVRYASDGSGDCAARFWVSSTRPSARTDTAGTLRTLSRTGGWTTWATSSSLADSGSEDYWLQIGGPNSGQAINVMRVDFSKDTFATPGSITFDTPTYGQSQALSWGAVSREDSGYRIEVDRGSGYVLYANVASGITSTNIPSSEFDSMGTRQFRVQARGSDRRLVSAWRTGTLRTVAKADQEVLTLTPATDHTYNTTRTNTAGGGAYDRLHVVFDLAGVDFIFSAFFRVCMSTARQLPPGHFAVINANPEIKRAFHMVELDCFFQVK